jgi:hypothetical protein
MDNPVTPENQDVLLEDALRTYPMAPMPRDITADVMVRIQTVPVPRPFRLAWSDMLLGVVLSLCVAAIWFSWSQLPPLVVAQIRKESILFYQYLLVNARWLIPMISFTLAGCLAALTLPYLQQQLLKKSA